MVMSALRHKADMCSALAYVRFGPKADIRFKLLINVLIARAALQDLDLERGPLALLLPHGCRAELLKAASNEHRRDRLERGQLYPPGRFGPYSA